MAKKQSKRRQRQQRLPTTPATNDALAAWLNARALYWQQILRVADWDIELGLCSRHEMQDAHNVGECEANAQERDATITLVYPEELPEHNRTYDYMDAVLLHEMLHLVFRETDVIDDGNVREEMAVRKLTKALLAATGSE